MTLKDIKNTMNRLSGYAFTTALALIAVMVFTTNVIAQLQQDTFSEAEIRIIMNIRITANGKTTVFELTNSQASKDLYAQLPINTNVENYSDNEKIFYPPKKLKTTDAPLADARAGTLAYYAPWGNVVMFYEYFGSASGLYELGHAVLGGEYIKGMTGTIQIDRVPKQ